MNGVQSRETMLNYDASTISAGGGKKVLLGLGGGELTERLLSVTTKLIGAHIFAIYVETTDYLYIVLFIAMRPSLLSRLALLVHLLSDVADGLTVSPHQTLSDGNCTGQLDKFLCNCLTQK